MDAGSGSKAQASPRRRAVCMIMATLAFGASAMVLVRSRFPSPALGSRRAAAQTAEPESRTWKPELQTSVHCQEQVTGGCLGKLPSVGESTKMALPALDLNQSTIKQGVVGETAQFFKNSSELSAFLSELAAGGMAMVGQSELTLNTELLVLKRTPVAFESILLTCHTKPGDPESEAVCLPPMRSQNFVTARVRLPTGDERDVLFTEHRVHPTDLNPLDGCVNCCFVERLMSNVVIRPAGQKVCETSCIHIHNIIEHAVLREALPVTV